MTTTTIHSLPIELITRIFVLGANVDYPYAGSPFLFKPVQNTFYNSPPLDFQVSVSHVCRNWREVALHTPHLWSTLHFHEPWHVERARIFLSRCRSTTFDILIATVSAPEHIPKVNLYLPELEAIFQLLVPYTPRWRSFHLKIRSNECKLVARKHLSTCGPGPRLETLQLYHFEDFGTSADLYIATYRPPVKIFNNELPNIKNVSLIGVNLPWEQSPFLRNLESLELALHLDNVRPSYRYWDSMLRGSPNLSKLLLHYSGPKVSDGTAANAWPSSLAWSSELPTGPIVLEALTELSLTDLDSEFLCRILEGMVMPNILKMSINLSDQDYSGVIGMLLGVRGSIGPSSSTVHKPLPNIHLLINLRIAALECSHPCFAGLIRALVSLEHLDVDFSRISGGADWSACVAACEEEEPDLVGAACERDADATLNLAAATHKRGPTPPLTTDLEKVTREDTAQGSEHLLPQGPVPRQLSSRRNSYVRPKHERAHLRQFQRPPILPNLKTCRVRGLYGQDLKNIIASREALRQNSVQWIVPCKDSAFGKDAVLDEIVENGGYFVADGKFIPVTIEIEEDDFEEDEDGEIVSQEDEE